MDLEKDKGLISLSFYSLMHTHCSLLTQAIGVSEDFVDIDRRKSLPVGDLNSATVNVSFSIIIVIAQIPYFRGIGEPQDVVVSSIVLHEAGGGVRGNLVLPCAVTGISTVAWFREGTRIRNGVVKDDGTLVLNVTEGVGATRDGVRYFCVAYNKVYAVSGTHIAVLKSRDAIVRHTCELWACELLYGMKFSRLLVVCKINFVNTLLCTLAWLQNL